MSTPHTSGGHPLVAVTTRSERVAQRSAAQGFFSNTAAFLKKDHRGNFIVLMFLASITFSCVIRAWNKPFHFRVNNVTDRAVICNTPFSVSSPEQKRLAIYHARLSVPHIFINDSQPLEQLREALWNTIAVLIRVNSYDELNEQERLTWLEFLRPDGQQGIPADLDVQAAFAAFIAYFKDGDNFDRLQLKLYRVFTHFEIHGVLMRLPFGPERGSQDKVLVYRKQDTPDRATEYKTSDVLIRDGMILRESLHREMKSVVLGDQLFNWLYPKFPETLKEDPYATAKIEEKAVAEVQDVRIEYTRGQLLVDAGVVLQQGDVNLLLDEYKASVHNRQKTKQIYRFVAVSSVFFLVFVIMVSLVFRSERRRPHTPQTFFFLMLGMIVTVAATQSVQLFISTGTEWEILPLMLFVMFVSIIYSWELATILSIFLTIIIVNGNGGSMHLFIMLLSTSVVTAVQLGRLRSRRKMVVVGMISGLIAFFMTISLGIQEDRFFGKLLYTDATINFLWALLAGLLMTGVLPFIEKQFGILTDMSLLELGDVSHPLMRELIKVAPATYGHSMQVGAIAETAAEAIEARGLFTRVGAYFHDIGKIMKPEYFSENQGGHDNVHDTIEPQISTIVLVAHVKDGVDIARKYRLPKPLIDLIEQHHGTSLASFFYGRATKGGKEGVEENTFRYPGPKPKTKEAAILMIADTCESACRSMGTGVSPNKIEGKVRALVKQKLDDGQFDDSGLTLNELKIVEKSVINSIVAAMHGRIQYPEGPHARDAENGHSGIQQEGHSGMQPVGIENVF